MIYGIIILTFVIGVQFLIIISLCAQNLVVSLEKGVDSMNNIFSSKAYDWLKWIAIVALPALSTFIVVISKIWGWGDVGGMIAQTITAVAVLLGALLGISTIQYNKGASE